MIFAESRLGSRTAHQFVSEYVNCPECGKEVEIWIEEPRAARSNYGTKVSREQ